MRSTEVVFDIGGTAMRVALAGKNGLSDIRKVPTPKSPREGVRALSALARELARGEAIAAAAGGFPGSLSSGVVLRAANLGEWEDFELSRELSNALDVEVDVRNDAECAALGEALLGAGRGSRFVAYIGVGTGVGCGRIVDGRIDSGVCHFEAGHQIVDIGSGKDLEDMVSGRAFETRFGMHPSEAPRASYDEMTPVLAAGLYNMILHWSPEVFVLGGSMMNEANGYRMEDVKAALGRLPQGHAKLPDIRPAELKDTAGLYGASMLLRARENRAC